MEPLSNEIRRFLIQTFKGLKFNVQRLSGVLSEAPLAEHS